MAYIYKRKYITTISNSNTKIEGFHSKNQDRTRSIRRKLDTKISSVPKHIANSKFTHITVTQGTVDDTVTANLLLAK